MGLLNKHAEAFLIIEEISVLKVAKTGYYSVSIVEGCSSTLRWFKDKDRDK